MPEVDLFFIRTARICKKHGADVLMPEVGILFFIHEDETAWALISRSNARGGHFVFNTILTAIETRTVKDGFIRLNARGGHFVFNTESELIEKRQ